MTDDDLDAFKKDLADVLNKHKVSLSVEIDDCSDMNGIYDVRFSVYDSANKEHRLNDCWGISASDLAVDET